MSNPDHRKIHWRNVSGPKNRGMCGIRTDPEMLTNDQSNVTCGLCIKNLGIITTTLDLDAAAVAILDRDRAKRSVDALIGTSVHPDDIAVNLFAAEMKRKLARKREAGYSGWDQPYDENTESGCTIDFLWYQLREHIDKGDPVDIGNFAMMIYNRVRMGKG
jgi:hypothetical protein